MQEKTHPPTLAAEQREVLLTPFTASNTAQGQPFIHTGTLTGANYCRIKHLHHVYRLQCIFYTLFPPLSDVLSHFNTHPSFLAVLYPAHITGEGWLSERWLLS